MQSAFLVLKDNLQGHSPILRKIQDKIALTEDPQDAEAILVLGGDGTILKAIRRYKNLGLPFLGINFGHLGFLMNDAGAMTVDELLSENVQYVDVRLLQAKLYDSKRKKIGEELAFNDFYFERTSSQAAKINVAVDGVNRFSPLVCDGVIVSTPAGSTAYNAAAGGVILPIGVNSMVLTGICPMMFHNWKSSQLATDARVALKAEDTAKRPVRFIADGFEIPEVTRVEITYSQKFVRIGFAASQNFREKVMRFQFHSLARRRP